MNTDSTSPHTHSSNLRHDWEQALLSGENGILKMIVKGEAISQVLAYLCHFVETLADGLYAGVLLLDRDGRFHQHGAAPSLPEDYNQAMHGRTIGLHDSPCGMAISLQKTVICSDLTEDFRWEECGWRALALQHAFKACWSVPILSDLGRVLGTLSLYGQTPQRPSAEHIKMLENLRHLAAVAIASQRLETAPHERDVHSDITTAAPLHSREELRLAIDTMPGLVWSSLPDGHIDYLNARWLGYTGLRLDQGAGWGWQRAIHPDDLPGLMSYWKSVLSSGQPGEYEARLRKYDGEYRWFLFRAVPLYDCSGTLVKWYGTNTDIEALRVSEHIARGQLDTLVGTLEALSRESAPEKFLEHVLKTICNQFDAHSLSVWELTQDRKRVQLLANFENGAIMIVPQSTADTSTSQDIDEEEHPVWAEFFATGRYCVMGDIQADTVLVRVAEDRNAPWHDWSSSVVLNPLSQSIIERLHALGITSTLAIPMFIAGKVTGLVSIRFTRRDSFRHEQIELGRALAHQAMLAIELGRLAEQSRRTAIMEERNRLARDIHDTLAQGFTGVIIQLEAAADARVKGLNREADVHIGSAIELARDSLNEARRSVRALRPQVLKEKKLCEAVAELIERGTRNTSLHGTFQMRGQPFVLPQKWNGHILYICQEVLTNALRHARATEFLAEMVFTEDHVQVRLRDNGVGFNTTMKHEGFGLLGIRERVDKMGGELFLDSQPGSHTEVALLLKLTRDGGPHGG